MRPIAIVNQSTVVSLSDVSAAVAALQIQLDRDFSPAWGIWARLGVNDGAAERILVLDDTNQADALGYHTITQQDVQDGEAWPATLSHELLEQLCDPLTNLAAEGSYQGKAAVFAFEVCDPVENDEYQINGIPVSNFVLPSWFQEGYTGRVDHLGRLSKSFTLSPGGYISYQTRLGSWQQWFGERTPHRQRWPGRYCRRQHRLARSLARQAD